MLRDAQIKTCARGAPVSVQALSWVLTHSKARLASRLVLLAIADNADDSGHNAWPSVPTIARKALVTARQVQRALAVLVGLQELLIIPGGGPGGAHMYQVLMGGDKLSPGGVTNLGGGGDKSGGVIRKNRPEPSKTITPPTPLRKGGADLTPRPHTRKRQRNQPYKKGACDRHPESGLTQWATCWDCYLEQYGSDRAEETGGSQCERQQ
jgi:helix-turn-helix protein